MNIMILGEPMDPHTNPNYRGIFRSSPTYCEHLSEDHPANQAFRWYINEGGQEEVVHNIDNAILLIEEYKRLSPPQYFELIEIFIGKDPNTSNGIFLGYDLSAYLHFSFLYLGMEYSNSIRNIDLEEANALSSAIEYIFKPRLNQYGLLNDYKTAQWCLNCHKAIQKLNPNYFENDEIVAAYEPVALYKID